MINKMRVLMSELLVFMLLAGCSSDAKQQNVQGAEQNTQVQIENHMDINEEGYLRGEQIVDQTFELNLEPIGEVTFASYLPDNSENPLMDVVFLIEQDGKILSQLPGVSEDNVNSEIFHQVEAVNFLDYNHDGCDDIILIISYYPDADRDIATLHSTIRYYTGSETGAFTYEKQMSEDGTSALAEITITSAKEFIGYVDVQNSDSQNDVTDVDKSNEDEMYMTETNEDESNVVKTDMDPLYEAFLKNEISVSNPYVEGMQISVMDDQAYESEFEDAQKSYALVDVNDDEKPELVFKISSYPSELLYILGIYNDELICFDVMETHTESMAFGVYDYGMVWTSQNYDGFEMKLYTYTVDGKPTEVRRFTEGDEEDMAAHEGNDVEWIIWNGSQEG